MTAPTSGSPDELAELTRLLESARNVAANLEAELALHDLPIVEVVDRAYRAGVASCEEAAEFDRQQRLANNRLIDELKRDRDHWKESAEDWHAKHDALLPDTSKPYVLPWLHGGAEVAKLRERGSEAGS